MKINRHFFTEDRLPALIEGAYSLSHPMGMGYLHHIPGPLDADALDHIIKERSWDDLIPGGGTFQHMNQKLRVYMDYVRGRAVKLRVWQEGARLYVEGDSWFDHTKDQWDALLEHVGVTTEETETSP